MVARALDVVLGLWLVAAGLLLGGDGDPARVADVAAGAALVAIVLLAPPGTPAGFAAILLGSWVMIAPLFLSYASGVNAVNDVLTGFAIVAVTLHPNLGARWRAARWAARS
jgi:hypothetical protein